MAEQIKNVLERLTKFHKKGEGKKDSKLYWDYDKFQEYLLALTRGPNFLLPLTQSPTEFILNSYWHTILNRMRGDKVENYAIVGFKTDQRSLWIRDYPIKGATDHVPSEIIEREYQEARDKAGIIGAIGDLHSHPRMLGEKICGAFSAADLFWFLKNKSVYLKGITDGQNNIFAFKSREVVPINFPSHAFNLKTFEKIWYENNGFVFDGSNWRSLSSTDEFQINIAIAKKHNLVLYKGSPNQPLKRVSLTAK